MRAALLMLAIAGAACQGVADYVRVEVELAPGAPTNIHQLVVEGGDFDILIPETLSTSPIAFPTEFTLSRDTREESPQSFPVSGYDATDTRIVAATLDIAWEIDVALVETLCLQPVATTAPTDCP